MQNKFFGLTLAFYALLACGLTFPAILAPQTQLIGAGDNFGFVWELWWFSHALIERGINPLNNDTLFFPTPSVSLVWSTPVNLLPGMGLTQLFGPVVAYNLLVMGGLALAGHGAYLLAYHFIRNYGAALLAGAIFAFAPAHMAHVANGHLNIMTIQWLPYFLLTWFRLHETPTWRKGVSCALALSLVLLTDLYIALYFLTTFLSAFLVFNLLQTSEPRSKAGFWRIALLVSATALAVASPFYIPSITNLQGATVTIELRESVHRFGQDLVQLFLPAPWNPLLGSHSLPWTPKITNTDNWGYLGWVPLTLAALAVVRRSTPQRVFWVPFTVLAVILSMGTYLHAGGPTGIPLPYWVWAKLPLLENFRAPGRFIEVAALGLAVLAAAGFVQVNTLLRVKSWCLLPILLVAIGLEYLTFLPFPTTSAIIPEFYRSLAEEPRVGGVLELPNGDPTWGGPTQRWMYYQTLHRHPLVYGHSPRVTDKSLAISRSTPVVYELVNLIHTEFKLDLDEKYHNSAKDILAELGITHVILHSVDIIPPLRYKQLEKQLTELFGRPYFRDADIIAFRISPFLIK